MDEREIFRWGPGSCAHVHCESAVCVAHQFLNGLSTLVPFRSAKVLRNELATIFG